LEIEKRMYWSRSDIWNKNLKKHIRNTFLSCLENFPEGFFVAVRNNKITGFIILELIDDAKTIPYVHDSRDFHKSNGNFAYVTGFGVLIEDLSLELYTKAIEFAKLKGREKIVVVTHHEKRHDLLERTTLLSLKFKKEAEMTDWKLYHGRVDKADIWTRKL
ncbi:MAG: hypothetical protein NT129_01315, partial [Candidatus Aenigmarchaeota archaeon]|nr:hypothetical protein [Candidatus Aenigmarchaeota archaeon]